MELSSGSLIPGDVRILECQHLLINQVRKLAAALFRSRAWRTQSVLTGESLPVEKSEKAHEGDANSDFLTRANLAFMCAAALRLLIPH